MDPEDQLRCHATRHELLQVRKQHGQGEARLKAYRAIASTYRVTFIHSATLP